MKTMELSHKHTKVMLVQFTPHSSDPRMHDHGDDFQVSIPLIGNSHVEHNNAFLKLDHNHRLITSPGEQHRHFVNDVPGKLLLINIKNAFLQQVLEERIQQYVETIELSMLAEGGSEKLKKITEKLVKQSFDSIDQAELLETEIELATLLLTLQPGSHSEKWKREVTRFDHPLLNRVVEFIHSSYSEELSLEKMAEVSGMSKFHFLRKFKENLGMTPNQYVTNVRVSRAEELLTMKKMDITSIAYEVGFGSLHTFERVFKQHKGVSASEYRKLF